jgi:hypothetical protein
MTKRFAHIQALVALRTSVLEYPNPADAVHDAIVDALPPGYRKVYAWICQGVYGGKVTTPMVMKAWGWKSNMASTVLNELWQFGLLKRSEQVDEHGKRFVYEVAD